MILRPSLRRIRFQSRFEHLRSTLAVFGGLFFLNALLTGCASTLPEEHHSVYKFPENKVFVDLPTGEFAGREYETLGWVKARSHFPTMEEDPNSAMLCKNYYNKAARSLLRDAQKAKADAVIQVRSVVMTMDGKVEEYKTAECSDDGAEGEILLRAIAIRYKKPGIPGKEKRVRVPITSELAPASNVGSASTSADSPLNAPLGTNAATSSAVVNGNVNQPMTIVKPAPTPVPLAPVPVKATGSVAK